MSLPTDFDDCQDPQPRSQPLPLQPVVWPVRIELRPRDAVAPRGMDFLDVLERRRSIRDMCPAPLRETVNLLVYGHAQRSPWGTNPRRSARFSHSAGALHPVEVLLVSGSRRNRILRIEPAERTLQLLRIADQAPLNALNAKLAEMLPNARGDYIVLLADRSLTASQYSSARNLVWRDAGALMQTLHFCATAFRMAFCPAGIDGSEIRDAVFGADDRFEGVGVAALGRPI